MILQVTEEERNRCFEFATNIINGGNQFNRFQQNLEVQINRTYIGKLAEYVFLHYLHHNGKVYNEGDMFQIFQGAENADQYDFITRGGETVDIKTASLPFHSRIMAPIDQFHLAKSYYVGMKLNFEVNGKTIVPNSIKDCELKGYVNRATMETQLTSNFGEGDCKAYSLNLLSPIEPLLNMF